MGGENIFGEGLPIDGASETEGMGWRRGSDKGFDFEVSYDKVVISDVEGRA